MMDFYYSSDIIFFHMYVHTYYYSNLDIEKLIIILTSIFDKLFNLFKT